MSTIYTIFNPTTGEVFATGAYTDLLGENIPANNAAHYEGGQVLLGRHINPRTHHMLNGVPTPKTPVPCSVTANIISGLPANTLVQIPELTGDTWHTVEGGFVELEVDTAGTYEVVLKSTSPLYTENVIEVTIP